MRISELARRYAGNRDAVVVVVDAAGRRQEITHAGLAERVAALAEALVGAGVRARHVVGIQARNSIEWIVWDLAVSTAGAVVQAFPAEMAIGDADAFLAEHGLALLVTDDPPAAHPAVLRPDETPAATQVLPRSARPIDDAGVHTLVYSSGTSGQLKGLLIGRRGSERAVDRFLDLFRQTGEDKLLLFLPLANYQQRLLVYGCLWTGADVVLVPYDQVFAAMNAERPTIVLCPPLFYDAALRQSAESGGGRSLGEFLGGRIRIAITGMAPIRRATLDAFRDAGVNLLEAYGMTEYGLIARNTPDAYRIGTVGRLIDPEAVEIQPDGELLVRSAVPLCLGYFQAEAETARQTFLTDGAIATGDIGELDEDGFLRLIGRKKDAIPLGDGRKIHPAEIESLLAAVDGIAEVVVVATPGSHRLGALVTPVAPGNARLRMEIANAVERINEAVESPRRVTTLVFNRQSLHSDPRLLTKNLKLSRPAAAAYFAERLDAPGTSPAVTLPDPA